MSIKPDWWVYSTASEDRSLLVEDRNSGDRGYVPDPTKTEWNAAFHAPSNPYPWHDTSRVIVDNETAAPFSDEVKEAALEMVRRRCQGT
jgi:hypothetical protein